VRQLCTIVAIAYLVCQCLASHAYAGTYDVQSCEENLRTPVHFHNWTLMGPSGHFGLDADCTAGPTRLASGSAVPPGTEGRLRFRVNHPLTIVEMTYRQHVFAPASVYPPNEWWWDFEQHVTGEDGVTRLAGQCPGQDNRCDEFYGGATVRDRRSLGFEWVLRCSASSAKACSWSEVRVLEATFKLEDPLSPKLMAPPGGGIFAGQSPVSGIQGVTFGASDAGSGLQRAVLEIDGATAAETTFSNRSPSCRPPYTVPEPCPSELTASMAVDTARYVDGQHQARLVVFDATGTNQTVYGPVSFISRNETLDSYCEVQDARRFQLHTPKKAVAYGSRLHFRASVKHAPGWEALLLTGAGRVSTLAAGTVSSRDHFSAKISAGRNRILRVAVRPPGHTGKFICSAPRRLRVRAKVSLRVSARRASNGRAITLEGRIYGQRKRRKALILQARAVGSPRWATVRVLRTRPDGRYRLRYRFRRTFATVTYAFRSQVRAERGYPYATGYSAQRRVRVVG
jgi:hypothetical protein